MTNRTFLHVRYIAVCATLLLACAVTATHAQQFTLQNPIPTPSQLNGIQAVGGGVIYAAGNYNAIVESTNGGATWSTQTGDLDALNSYQGIFFQSATRGWAFGGSPVNGGSIEFTNNGGTTWSRQLIQSANVINDVYFQSPTQGWAIGTGHEFATPTISKPFILYSSDIGNTWTRQILGVPTKTNDYMISIGFATNATGWAVGYDPAGDFLLNTTNSGTQWTTQMSFPVGTNISNLLVSSVTKMYAVGDVSGTPAILLSLNGGTTWTTYSFPAVTGHIINIAFPSALVGYAGGWKTVNGLTQPYVLKTTNGGASWSEATAGANLSMYNPTITAMAVADANTVYLSGNYNGGLIVSTTNGGLSWEVDSYNAAAQNGYNPEKSAISFSDTLNGWAVGYNTNLSNASAKSPVLLTTSNGGSNWTPASFPQYTNAIFTGVSALTPSSIRIAGFDYVANTSFVLTTTNGGTNWTSMPTPGGSSFVPSDISFASASNGILAGSGAGEIYYTTNGGLSWTAATFTNYTPGNVFKIGSFYGANAWVSADNGTYILNTTNGGQSWTATNANNILSSENNNQYYATGVSFIPSGIYGWVCGYQVYNGNEGGFKGKGSDNNPSIMTANGTISPFLAYTTNGGQSWTEQDANIMIPNYNYVPPSPNFPLGIGNPDTTLNGQFNNVQDIIAVSQLGAIAVSRQINDSPYPGNRILSTTNGGQVWLTIDSLNAGTDYRRISAKLTNRIDAWTLSTSASNVAEIRHGEVTVPRLTATPNSLFSTTILSFNPTDSAIQSVKITNIGSAALTINSATFSPLPPTAGTDSNYWFGNHFIWVKKGLDYFVQSFVPFQIAPGATDSIEIKFKPTSFGETDEGLAFASTLTISSNAIDTPTYSVSLLGSSGSANVESTPSSLFGTTIVPIDSTSKGVIHVCNDGRPGVDALLEAGNLQLSETADYSIVRAITQPIAPGACDSIIVQFKPVSGGPKSGTLTFSTNTRTNPTITVTLGGVGGVRMFASNLSSISFSDTVGCAPVKDSIMITNAGTLPTTIDSIAIAGGAASDLSMSLTKFNDTIQAGASKTYYVTYTPNHYKANSETILIMSNANDTPMKTITLTTVGLEGFLITPTKTFIDSVPYNSPLTKFIVVKDTGNVPVYLLPPNGGLPGLWQIDITSHNFPDPLLASSTDSIGIYHKPSESTGTWDTLSFIISWGNSNSDATGFGCGPMGLDTVTFLYYLEPNPASVREMNAIASSFSLMQNYPNPFASATTVQYAIPEQAFVTLTVFDALGREVKQLVNENQIAGVYTASFDATSLPNGTYFYELRAGSNMKRMMMTVAK